IAAGAGHAAEVGALSVQVASSTTFRAALYTLGGTYLEDVPVLWSSSAGTLAATEQATVIYTPTTPTTTIITATYIGSDVEVIKVSDTTGIITVTSDQVPSTMVLVAGNNQSGTVDQALPAALQVRVRDAFNIV